MSVSSVLILFKISLSLSLTSQFKVPLLTLFLTSSTSAVYLLDKSSFLRLSIPVYHLNLLK